MFGMCALAWSGMTCVGDMYVQRVGGHAYVRRMGVQQDGVCAGMVVQISIKKKNTHLGVGIIGVHDWCACVRRVGVWMWICIKKERKKNTKKNTYLGVDDGCMCACKCVACGCRLV